jgi:hypothetical protein
LPNNSARQLWMSGRSHGVAAQLLYSAALEEGRERFPEDPEHFAFNGTYSLSIFNLFGLAIELMLKAAFVNAGGDASDQSLKRLGHKLVETFTAAQDQGFVSEAPNLAAIIEVLDQPYRESFFRYRRPEQFGLPSVEQVINCLSVLDDELGARIGVEANE